MACSVFLLSLCLMGLSTIVSAGPHTQTALDIYVNTPDPTYEWHLISTSPQDGYTIYFINLTSQTWLTASDSSKPVWTHWLSICVPDKVLYNTALIYIDGGSNQPQPPTEMDSIIQPLCPLSNAVIAELDQIPNQPITFAGNGQSRYEDEIIAYTWAHFINDTSEPNWLLRLPMTKSVVRAMDTIQTFVSSLSGVTPVKDFVVCGASKRGWTTWTTGAVDSRVTAMIPIVIPILNIVPNINHQWRAYGQWSFALNDYEDMGVMKYLNDPQFVELAAIVDPYSYVPRYQFPKYLICASGDEFFLPDSMQFFYKDLIGETHLRVVPNAEHSLIGHQADVMISIGTFYYLIVNNIQRPQISYEIIKSNETASITVTLLDNQVPYLVKVWQASTLSFIQRDFRLLTCDNIEKCIQPVFWYDTVLTSNSTTYSASVAAPKNGWIGFFIELDYRYGENLQWQFVVSTEVNVVPDILPFPPCGQNCQP